MDFEKLIHTRQSVRAYSDMPVEKEKIEKCLEAVRLSPSACNSQPWYFIVVEEPVLREKVAQATFGLVASFNKFALQSPVLIVQVSKKPNLMSQFGAWAKERNFRVFDNGIAAAHFCLQAADLGLGTCMLGWFDEGKIKDLLDIPKSDSVELVITLGYAKDTSIRQKQRKNLDQISHFI